MNAYLFIKFREFPVASVRYLSGTEFVETIMKEIMENGPVTAAMDAYEDLMPGLMGKTVYTVSSIPSRISILVDPLLGR